MVDENNREYANKKYNLKDYKRSVSEINEVIIHCTATDTPRWDNPLACIDYDLGQNHISDNGCPTATYHFYINKQGKIYQLVSMNYKTWNCKGRNNGSVAVCINHGAKKENVSAEQFNALIDSVKYIFQFMEWSLDEDEVRRRVKFHRHYNSGKSCPGFLNYEEVVKQIINSK